MLIPFLYDVLDGRPISSSPGNIIQHPEFWDSVFASPLVNLCVWIGPSAILCPGRSGRDALFFYLSLKNAGNCNLSWGAANLWSHQTELVSVMRTKPSAIF